jgi:HKD family nuclease
MEKKELEIVIKIITDEQQACGDPVFVSLLQRIINRLETKFKTNGQNNKAGKK